MNQDQKDTINKMFAKLIEKLIYSPNLEEAVIHCNSFYNDWMCVEKKFDTDNSSTGSFKFFLDDNFKIAINKDKINLGDNRKYPSNFKYCVFCNHIHFRNKSDRYIRLYEILENPNMGPRVSKLKLELKNSEITEEIKEKIHELKFKLRERDNDRKKKEESDKVKFAENILNKLGESLV